MPVFGPNLTRVIEHQLATLLHEQEFGVLQKQTWDAVRWDAVLAKCADLRERFDLPGGYTSDNGDPFAADAANVWRVAVREVLALKPAETMLDVLVQEERSGAWQS